MCETHDRGFGRRSFLGLLTIGAAQVAVGCTTVPITGRSQLRLVSDRELELAADRSYADLIAQARAKNAILQSSESDKAAETNRIVARVAGKIVEVSGLRQQYRWSAVTLKSRDPNAFVLPNGKIAVFTGILPVAKNEAGLAAILGHEVAHVTAGHRAERVSQALLAQAITDIGKAMADKKQRAQIEAALGVVGRYGVLLPFSRAHESEADHIGQLYMAKAGYNPEAAVYVWERMAALGGQRPPEFLSTHPSDQTRIRQLRQWLPQAMEYYRDPSRPLPTAVK